MAPRVENGVKYIATPTLQTVLWVLITDNCTDGIGVNTHLNDRLVPMNDITIRHRESGQKKAEMSGN